MNKKTFEVEIDGKKTKLAVHKPNQKQSLEAQKVQNRALRDALESGAIVRAAIDKVLREQGLWDDKRQTEFETLQKKLAEGEKVLLKGGIKLSEGRNRALDMRRTRADLRRLLSERNAMDLYTADAQAEQARFNYLVGACTTYEEGLQGGKPVFKSTEDYVNRAGENWVNEAASQFGRLVYDLEDDWEAKLPENKWLLDKKMVNEKLHLVDRDGNLVDADGKRVDDQGYLLDDKGRRVDSEGTPLKEDGSYDIVEEPFVDDLGWTKTV